MSYQIQITPITALRCATEDAQAAVDNVWDCFRREHVRRAFLSDKLLFCASRDLTDIALEGAQDALDEVKRQALLLDSDNPSPAQKSALIIAAERHELMSKELSVVRNTITRAGETTPELFEDSFEVASEYFRHFAYGNNASE